VYSRNNKLVKSQWDGYGKRPIYKALWFFRIETIQVRMLRVKKNHNNAVDGTFYDAIKE